MANHYEAAIGHRQNAQDARRRLDELHDADRGTSNEIRRAIGKTFDTMRHSLKLAEIDALLAIGQALRDLRSTIEYGGKP
jgi:hypothetical protein